MRLFKTTYTTPDVSFQSTHPARGATVLIARPGIHPLISIHAPREGCDRRSGRRFPCRRNFNPRTPRGVRHRAIGAWQAELEFQSTHPARGATPSKIGDRGHNRISIHAPREGCDAQLRPQSEGHIVISIHAPREGCDLDTSRGCTQGGISIHAPREGCDRERARSVGGGGDFNPRTPRGVRPQDGAQRFPVIIISIHAPREGCDPTGRVYQDFDGKFQSTHPARGATSRAGTSSSLSTYFNPRTPRGVRQRHNAIKTMAYPFQSTHPARGATANFTKEQRVCLAQFAYLHKGKKAEHTKTNAPMLH